MVGEEPQILEPYSRRLMHRHTISFLTWMLQVTLRYRLPQMPHTNRSVKAYLLENLPRLVFALLIFVTNHQFNPVQATVKIQPIH